MSDEPRLTPGISPGDSEFERALESLIPRTPQFTTDAIAFRLGHATAQRRMRIWQGATGSLAAAVLIMAILQFAPAPNSADSPPRDISTGFIAEKPPAHEESHPAPAASFITVSRPVRPAPYVLLRANVLGGGVGYLSLVQRSTIDVSGRNELAEFERYSPLTPRRTPVDSSLFLEEADAS